jgi:acetyl-CoA acetyltransferase
MTWAGRGRTAIAGIGFSELSRHSSKGLGQLAMDACRAALEDAGLDASKVDGLATYPDAPYGGAGRRDGVDIVTVNYFMKHFPLAENLRWYSEIDQGMIASAVIEGMNALISGMASYVLVWRAMHQPAGAYGVVRTNTAAGDSQFSLPYGQGAVFQWHAMAYRRYLHLSGGKRESMAWLATNQRRNANMNPRAYFRDVTLSEEDYLNARMIADPLCLFDCDIPIEGCAALLLTTAERARDLKQPPAYIASMAQNTAGDPSPMSYILADYMKAGGTLANQLWADAGIGPKDVGAAQLYDGFAPSTLYWLEAAGFCPQGEAHHFIQDGRIAIEGELPVNTFGGSLSEGRLHGMGHIAEAALQVTNRAGPRQVNGCEVSCAIDGSPLLKGSGLVLTKAP